MIPVQTSPDLESLREEYWNKTDFSNLNEEQKLPFFNFLIQYSKEAGKKKEFSNAKISQSMAFKLRQDMVNSSSDQYPSQIELENLAQKENVLKQQQEKDLTKLNETFDQKRKFLSDSQQKEMEKFEKFWKEEKFLQYRKPSLSTLDKSYRVEKLLKLGELSAAELMSNQYETGFYDDFLQKQRQFVQDYNRARNQLSSKHQDQQNILESQYEINMKLLCQKLKFGNENLESRKRCLQKKPHFKSKPLVSQIYYTKPQKTDGKPNYLPLLRPEQITEDSFVNIENEIKQRQVKLVKLQTSFANKQKNESLKAFTKGHQPPHCYDDRAEEDETDHRERYFFKDDAKPDRTIKSDRPNQSFKYIPLQKSSKSVNNNQRESFINPSNELLDKHEHKKNKQKEE